MKQIIFALFAVFVPALLPAGTENLIPGDSDAELSPRTLTVGPWSNSTPAAPLWKYDKTQGCESKSSIRAITFCGIGTVPVKLPAGEYTFSFYAKADKPGTTAYITVNPVRTSWPQVLKRRAAGRIGVSTEWKRYSHTFTADGNSEYAGYYGVERDPANFDRFMINGGKEPAIWAPAAGDSVAIGLPEAETHVYTAGKSIPVTVTMNGKAGTKGELKLTVKDYRSTIKEQHIPVVFDRNGRAVHRFELPAGRIGWFLVEAETGKGIREFTTVAVVPEPEAPALGAAPFVGLCGAQQIPETARKIGVGWCEFYLIWRNSKDQDTDFNSKLIHELRKRGFKLKVLICSYGLASNQEPEIRKLIAEGAPSHRFLMTPAEVEGPWVEFIRAFMKKHGNDVEIFEIGGELDALIGLNTHYKSKYPNQTIGPFVAGPILDRLRRWIEVTARTIREEKPSARISASRPSDVDARHGYAYSKALIEPNAKYLDTFGIDCYPQPRWIAADQPPTGSEQDLAIRNRDALAAMKNAKGRDVFISEYGYFIDHAKLYDLRHQREQANRLARSYLQARLCGMSSLYWFTATYGGSLEAGRFVMSISANGRPFAALAALAAVGNVVENVVKSEDIPLSLQGRAAVFAKNDGRAVAAFWALSPDYSPGVELPAANLEVRDIMGTRLELPVKEGKIRFDLTEEPIYVWRKVKNEDNFAVLQGMVKALKLKEPLPAEFFLRPAESGRLKIYFRNLSLKDILSGSVTGKLGDASFRKQFLLPANGTVSVSVPMGKPGTRTTYSLHFDGDEGVHRVEYTVPVLTPVRRVASQAEVEKLPPVVLDSGDRIMPVDHTTWSGAKDISAKMRFGHDGKKLYIVAEVTDDAHFNKFDLARIWRGDCMQLGFDPLTNNISQKSGFDPDDITLTLARSVKGEMADVHHAPDKAALRKALDFSVTRDEGKKLTTYRAAIPLESIHASMKSGRIFGLSAVFMDDDSDSGADYWLFLSPGLAGGQKPDQFQPFILE